MKIQRLILSCAIALSLLVSAAGLIGPTYAQNNAAGVTVSPVTDDFTITPGQTIVRTVRVINPGNEVVTLYPQILNFGTDNDEGRPVFYTLKDKNTKYAISEWITFSKSILKIAPSEEEQFEVTVKAPVNAEPGGKYGAILFSTEEPQLSQDATQIGVVGLTGTLLLARVPGAVRSQTIISSFDGPSFLISPPAKFTLTFKNLGNIHSRPTGEIKIRNMFGNSVKSLAINPGSGAVLPESERKFEAVDETRGSAAEWRFDWKTIGRFTANTAIEADGQQLPGATITFIVIPLWLIVAIVCLIIAIFLIIVIGQRKRGKEQYINQLPNKSKPTQPQQPIEREAQPKKKSPYVMR